MNVFLYARGNKSVNRLTLVGAAANVGRGNVARDVFEKIDIGAAKLRDELRRRRIGITLGIGSGHQIRRDDELQRFGTNAGAIGDDEVGQAKQRLVLFPHGNVEKRVGADDEKNSVAMGVICVAEITDRVDGIMQLRARKIFAGFRERWNEMRMLRAGQRHHRIAVGKRREMLFELVRRAAGGNEVNFVEIETAVGSARNGEMSVVDGVEGPAEQCDAAGMMFCGSAVGLRSGQ